MVAGVIGDGAEFCGVNFAFFVKNAFVGANVDDFADHCMGFRVIAYKFAFKRHGKFVDKRSINKFGFGRVEAGSCEFIRNFVAGFNADVVAFDNMGGVSHAYGESVGCKNVFGGFVAGADCHGDLVGIGNSAPGCVHCTGNAVFVISCKDENRHGVNHGFCAKVFSHIFVLLK